MIRPISMPVLWMMAGLLLLSGRTAEARIVPVADPPPDLPATHFWSLFEIERLDLRVDIDRQVARTTVEEWIRNTGPGMLEARYLFPVPKEAALSEFALWIDGEKVEAEILEREEARRIYQEIVRKAIDPGLVEYYGDRLVCIHVFPISPGEVRRIRLTYDQVLAGEEGNVRYFFPLRAECGGGKRPHSMNIDVAIEEDSPLHAVYSPSHELEVERSGDRIAFLSSEGTPADIRDLTLLYTMSAEEFGVKFFSLRRGHEDGFFAAIVTPSPDLDESDAQPKDILFVLDTSGSMKGAKIEQSLAALRYCVESLSGDDRFNVIDYASGVRSWRDGLAPATSENIASALDYLEHIRARGGTNIGGALEAALRQLHGAVAGEERPSMVVFLTDGRPTVGDRDVREIIAMAERANTGAARIFVLGVGHDVNTMLLDALYEGHGGAGSYVAPEEDVERAISTLFDKINYPLLTDVELAVEGVEVLDVYPQELPDLFRGSQVFVVGRYRGGGDALVTLTGNRRGARLRNRDEVRFERGGVENDFIPRLWAAKKIAFLTDDVRLHGANAEVIDEIVALSMEYGIITPYTSFLVTEDEPLAMRGGRIPETRHRQLFRSSLNRGDEPALAPGAPSSEEDRAEAFETSKSMLELKGKSMDAGSGEAAVEEVLAQELERLGDDAKKRVQKRSEATYLMKDGYFVDGRIAGELELEPDLTIRHASGAFFSLLEIDSRLGKNLAVGPNVIFLVGELVIRISEDEGETELPQAWRDRLERTIRGES